MARTLFTTRSRLAGRRVGSSTLQAIVIFALALAILAGEGRIAWGAPSRLIQNLRAGKAQKLATYGTSLTSPGPWPVQLNTWLRGQFPGKVTLVNGAIIASSSTNPNPVFDLLGRLDERVLASNPDTVMLEFAINDAFVDFGISLQQSRTNLNTMIDRIQAGRPDREVILMTMNPAWDVPGGLQPATARPNLPQYYQIFRDVAAERNLLLIDHYVNWTALRDSNRALFERYIPDGIHPIAAGTTAIEFPELVRALTVPEPGTWALGVVAFGWLVRTRLRSIGRPRRGS